VRTTLWNSSSSHGYWETFTSSGGSSSSSSSTSAIGGFEDVITLFAMTESSPASTKTKEVVGTIWYLHSKGVDTFYLTN